MTAPITKPKNISRFCALLAGGIGAIGLAGWIFDLPALQRLHPALVTMKANTAIALMLASLSLLLLQDEKAAGMKRRLAQCFAVMITLLGILTLAEHLFVLDFGIDQFLFRESPAAAGQSFQGRMGIASTIVFICLGLGLLFLDSRIASKYWATKLAFVAGASTTLVFLYYFYGIEHGEAVSKWATIALHTVVAFYALSAGVFFARPERGIMKELLGPSMGSVVARRMLPAAFFLPILLGWLRTLARDAGLFGAGFGTAAFVVLIILVLAGLIRWTVIEINRQEAERHRAEVALRRSEANLRDFVDNATVGLHWVGPDGIIIWANQAELNLLGYTSDEYVGRPITDFHADAPVIEDILARLTRGESLNEYEARLRRKDGSIRHVLINSNVRFEDGQFMHTRCFTRDITEKREGEAALARLAAIVTSCNDAIISKTLDGIITTWNPGAEKIFGYTAEEMIGQSLLRLIPPDLRGEEESILARLAAGAPVNHYETERVTKDGKRLAVSLTVSPVYSATGNIIGGSKIVRDITERKRAETALRESEERFRALVTASSDVVYRMNPNWTEMLWLDGQDFVSDTEEPSLTWLQEYIHPDDQPQVMEAIQEAIRTKSIFELEHQVLRVDGTVAWSFSRAIPLLGADGQIVEWFGTLSDETARKQAEEALHASENLKSSILNSALDAIITMDHEGKVIGFNPAAERTFGFRQAEIIGQVLAEKIIPKHLRERHYQGLARYLASGDGPVLSRRIEVPALHADGHEFYIELSINRILDIEPPVFTATLRDITERQQADEALRNALQETQRSARAKDDFLAALSHELRTPLTPVLMMATALGDDPTLPPEARDQLGMMRRNIELEARLIDDLLDLTRISHGKLAIVPVITDVHEVLNHTAEIVLSDRLGKDVSIVFTQEAVRHYTLADPTRLQQVFWNLIKNAIKFTPSGGSITVSTRNDADGRIIMTVADTGVGISAEALPHIFKAFEQGDVAGRHRYGGLGLGLAISKAIMEAHDGTIRVESAGQNRGATFTVTLASVDAPTASSCDPAARSGPLRSLRLLLVEDHETTRTVLANLLERRGHQITTASTINEALTAYAAKQFDAVISDLGLPDGNGLDLMREIQRQRPVPAIALSGYGMEEDVRRTREAGFSAHLVKPVNLEQLRQLIDQITPNSMPDA